jgi:1,4-alpha-glucan branching enzyme
VPAPTYPKTFRWSLPPDQTEVPEKVEVAGTFTGWQKYEMGRDVSGVWQINFENIPGHRTHHYMFFADGKPVNDIMSDGLAEPQGTQEAEYALATPRGPRVFMLFAQTK